MTAGSAETKSNTASRQSSTVRAGPLFHRELGRDERLARQPDVEFDLRAVSQIQRSARQSVLPRNRAELIRGGKNELERGRAKRNGLAINHDARRRLRRRFGDGKARQRK